MKLTKTTTREVRWCKPDFLPMSDKYRKVRRGVDHDDPRRLTTCFGCQHEFENGEMMALAQLVIEGGVGNRVLCQKCARSVMEDTP